jgi:hypothetical protein
LLEQSGIPNARIHYGLPEKEIDARLASFLKLPTEPVALAPAFAEQFDGSRQAGQLARLLSRATD